MNEISIYNNKIGLLIILVATICLFYYVGQYECPCNKKHNSLCYRTEFYGMQFNHLFFFIFLGIMFPDYFIVIQIFGIAFELLEILLDHYQEFTIKYLGGCYSNNPDKTKPNPPYFYKVWKNEKKNLNPIDQLFNLQPSKLHSFNGSIAEIIPNIIGFGIGWFINKRFFSI